MPATDSPHRVQLKRTKGWKMPADTVKIDRTTRWGNPFTVTDCGTSRSSWLPLPMVERLTRSESLPFSSAFSRTVTGVRVSVGETLAAGALAGAVLVCAQLENEAASISAPRGSRALPVGVEAAGVCTAALAKRFFL